MRLVIIGGDAAGMSAASRAGRLKPDTEIIVFEQTNDVSYSACGMPYNIANPERSIEDLVVREAEVFREKQGIDLRLGHKVQSIDKENKVITGKNDKGDTFEYSYDNLLIATGASSIIPDIPGIENGGVLKLKNLNDGRELKKYLSKNSVSKVVIIGMGYIALEMAESLRTLNIAVAMVKPRKRLLPWLNQNLSDIINQELEKNQVELFTGYNIISINNKNSELVVECDEINLKCQLVIPAIGVRPNSELAQNAGLDISIKNSIAVDRTTRTSDPNIYAAGDCADAYDMVTDKKTWVPLALQANRAGRAAADNICGIDLELQGISGSAVFKVFNLEVARAGLNMKEAADHGFEPVEINIESQSRAHSYPGGKNIYVAMVGDKRSGRLLGAQMVGEEGTAHRIHTIAVALHNKMTVNDFWQIDLAYAPPFSPVWDPLLTAANQLAKKIN